MARDRGLQPQRTELAWTRTSLAVLFTGMSILALTAMVQAYLVMPLL